MNTIKFNSKTTAIEPKVMDVFNNAKEGQAFIMTSSNENYKRITIKAHVSHKSVLVDLEDGYCFHEDGKTGTKFANGDYKLTPINIEITEL